MGIRRYIQILLIPVLALCFMISCERKSETENQLLIAESLIMERPDSSLSILQGIDTALLMKDREKALYGLLVTMAQDKNWLDPKNDSLINFAVGYFQDKKDRERLKRSTYYQGRVRYLNENYPEALVSFHEAKELAEQDEDYFYAGLACRGISDIYLKVSASADELNYAVKEYDYFKKAGLQLYLDYATYDLARAFHNSGEYDQSIKIINDVIESGKRTKDIYLYYAGLHLKAKSLYWKKSYEDADILFYEILKSGKGETEDSLYRVLTLIKTGNLKEAETLIKEVQTYETPLGYWCYYLINKKSGDFPASMEDIEIMNELLDSRTKNKKSVALSTALSNYNEINRKLYKAEISASKYKSGFILTTSILGFVIFLILILFLVQKHRREIEKKLLLVSELEFAIKSGLIEKARTEEQSKSKILEHSNQHFGLLNDLGDIIGRDIDIAIKQKQLLKYADSLLEDISREGSKLKYLETTADDLHGNIFSDFKKDFPDLKEKDYRLFLFSVLDFSNTSILLFLGEDRLSSVYSRRKRLKTKIQLLGKDKKKRYLSYL